MTNNFYKKITIYILALLTWGTPILASNFLNYSGLGIGVDEYTTQLFLFVVFLVVSVLCFNYLKKKHDLDFSVLVHFIVLNIVLDIMFFVVYLGQNAFEWLTTIVPQVFVGLITAYILSDSKTKK